MPERRDPPPTDEGWFALHDFRRVDWDAWQAATDDEREYALKEAIEYFQNLAAVSDAEEGATAIYSLLGHKADLLLVHLRPSTAHLDTVERGFETTALARYTDQPTSYVSVTEASGYSERAREYFEGDGDEDSGLAKYIRSRLHPTVPEAEHVCFYPMDKRRDPEQNWYALPFDERAEHMEAHGEIGRDYGGKVTQMITGSIGLDDWEWGVTLWADDLVDVKDLLYEMRFDASTAEFAEFGTFYVGRKIAPTDLPALLAGEVVPAEGDEHVSVADAAGRARASPSTPPRQSADVGLTTPESGGSSAAASGGGDDSAGSPTATASGDGGTAAGPPPSVAGDDGGGSSGPEPTDAEDMTARLATLGLHEGANFEPDQHGVICYSNADAQELAAEVGDLREQFDHYDSHVETVVRAQAGRSAVASLWETERAADTAAGFLVELPGVGESVTGPLGNGVAPTDDESAVSDEADASDESDASDEADAADDSDSTAESGAGSAEDTDETTGSESYGVGAKTIAEAASAASGSTTGGSATESDADDGDDGSDGHDGDDGSDADDGSEAQRAGNSADADDGGDEVDGDRSTADLIREELTEQNVYVGQPHGEDIFALVCYSSADEDELTAAVSELAEGFDRYDTHEGTDVYADPQGGATAVVSLWATQSAADTASEFLADLPGIVGWADEQEGFGTMGMFYTVKPEHREDFVETFAGVGELLDDMDGHRQSALLANVADENNMFIASQWDAKEDAMAFFRSEEFRETVEWGRDVLADRPRHVFLA